MTAVPRFPLASPEPWVAVAQAPATEMCGREAMFRQSVAGAMQVLAEIAVFHAGLEGHGLPIAVDADHSIQIRKGNEVSGAIGDGIERMARAEGLDLVGAGDDVAQLVDGLRMVAGRTVAEVAGPILVGVVHCAAALFAQGICQGGLDRFAAEVFGDNLAVGTDEPD